MPLESLLLTSKTLVPKLSSEAHMYELHRIISICDAAATYEDYAFVECLRTLEARVSEYRAVSDRVFNFISRSTRFDEFDFMLSTLIQLDLPQIPHEYFYHLLCKKVTSKRAATEFASLRKSTLEHFQSLKSNCDTLLAHLTSVDRILLFLRASHASTYQIDNILYIYVLRDADYYFVEYNLRATVSPDYTHNSGSLTASTRLKHPLHQYLYPEQHI